MFLKKLNRVMFYRSRLGTRGGHRPITSYSTLLKLPYEDTCVFFFCTYHFHPFQKKNIPHDLKYASRHIESFSWDDIYIERPDRESGFGSHTPKKNGFKYNIMIKFERIINFLFNQTVLRTIQSLNIN